MFSSTHGTAWGIFPASEVARPREISAGFCIATIVEPAQFDEAIVGDFARQVIERVAEKMHVTALPVSFGSILQQPRSSQDGRRSRRRLSPQAAFLQAKEKLFPAGGTLPVGHLHSSKPRRPSQSMPMATDTRSRNDYRALGFSYGVSRIR